MGRVQTLVLLAAASCAQPPSDAADAPHCSFNEHFDTASMMCVGPAVYALYKDRPDGDFHWSCQAPPAANELDFEFFDAFAGRSVLIARAPAGTQTFDTVSSWTWNFETTPVDADTSSVTFPVPNDHDISRFGDIVPEPANPYRATTLTANLTIGSAITAYTCTYVIGRLMP